MTILKNTQNGKAQRLWAWAFALIAALCLSFVLGFASPALAADSLTQCVNVTQTVSGSPSKTTYTYYLMPLENGNPMPAGTENNRYRFTLKGNDSTKIDITFTKPGTYNYELRRTEAAPSGDVVTPTAHPFGYVVKSGENGLEVIPFTCYDAYMEIRDENGLPTEIVLSNKISDGAGQPGKDGKDGEKGDTGPAGEKGEKGDTGPAGPAGSDGADGQDGAQGPKGDPGADGQDGKDGADGKNGADGKDGVNGKDGKNGTNGTNGKDGKTVTTTNVVTRTINRVVNTGDPYQVGLWLGLIVLSAGGMIFIAVWRRRKENDREDM